MDRIDAYRDSHAAGQHAAYRCRVDGALLLTRGGSVRRFRTLREAINAGRRAVAGVA